VTKPLLLLFVLGMWLPARSAELGARALTDTTDYLVGDWIAVRVELHHPPGTTFQMMFGDSLGPYRVLDRQGFVPVDSTETHTALVVARYDSGTSALPPLEFLASVPGDTTAWRVATAPLWLTVHTLAVTAQDSLRALKDPLSIPYTLGEILIALGVLAVLVAGGFYLYRRLKRRAPAPLAAAPQGPAKPPHQLALEELGMVKAKRLWQQGRVKEYHSEVTEVLRRYFERRFEVKALEETTDEILAGLQDAGLRHDVLDTVGSVLRRADLVKFATYQPYPEEHEESMSASVSVVERTRPVAPGAVHPPVKATPGHVGT
jgi:hypothetical protein